MGNYSRKVPENVAPEKFAGGILQYLRTAKKYLPQQQQVVCEFILNNFQKAAFLKAEEMAKASGSSTATVLRTAASLKFDSYVALKERLQEVLCQNSIPPLDRLRDTFLGIPEDNILEMVIEENIQNLRGMLTPHLKEQFAKSAALLTRSRRIYIIGLRSTRGVALYLHALLQQFLPDVFMVDATGTDTMLDVMMDMEKEDVLIALMAGSPHYTKRTIGCVRYAHENGIPTVLITNSLSSVAASLATVLLPAPQNTTHYSSVSFVTICDALVAMMGMKKIDSARRKIDKLGRLLVEYDISM